MSAINKIPRGLRVLIVMAILAALVWRFAANTDYYFYSIGVAIVITAGVIFAIYHKSRTPSSESKGKKKQKTEKTENEEHEAEALKTAPMDSETEMETIPIEKSYLDIPPMQRGFKSTVFQSQAPKPKATEVAGKYLQMTKTANITEKTQIQRPKTKTAPPSDEKPGSDIVNDDKAKTNAKAEVTEATSGNQPPLPLIEDETTLTEADKNELVNAVWYRCENPYCKNTSFLGVHHILDEKDGGTNKLDNLIVLCPYCHDLAHRNEIPEKEMRDWISNREERFKFKPQWHYY